MDNRWTMNDARGLARIDAAAYRKGVPAESILTFWTAVEIAARAPEEVPWIARPWAAVGAITEVMGQPKHAGKTTWVMKLVRCVLDGAAFLGEPTSQTPVVYLTEERESTFRQALQRGDLLERADLHILQWRDTLGVSWDSILSEAVRKCEAVGARLVVVDTISQFARLTGDRENNAGDVLEIYRPLQEAAARGLAVMSIRHERKGGGDVANAGRGSSAFAGAADILVAIRRPEGRARDTIRHIEALSRFDETPDSLMVELTETGYVVLDESAVAKAEAKGALLKAAPAHAGAALTLNELTEKTQVKRTTAQDAIDELTAQSRLQMVGKGVKGDPHRWFAPEIHSAETLSLRAAESIAADEGAPPLNVHDVEEGR